MYVESNHFFALLSVWLETTTIFFSQTRKKTTATRHEIKFCGPLHCFELRFQNDFKDSYGLVDLTMNQDVFYILEWILFKENETSPLSFWNTI